MRTYFLILALALLKVSMARPNADNADDFSIDMYQGNSHLRYERSNDATSTGTEVVIENVDADHAVHQTQTQKVDDALSVEESMKLAQEVITEWDAKTSEGQKTEVEAHNVEDGSKAVKDDEPAAAAKKETSSTVNEVKEVKEEVAKEKTVEKAAKEETSSKSSSKSTSKTEVSTASSRGQKDETSVEKPRYLFQYGDVLNRINLDKVSMLASKSRSKSSSNGKSKKLSKESAKNQGKGESISYFFVNGKEYTSGGPNSVVAKQTPQVNNFGGAPTQQNGFMAPPAAFGAPAFGRGFNPAYGGPPGPMYSAVHGQTHNLKSNLKMGFHGFNGFHHGMDNRMFNHGGVQMLNLRHPMPIHGAAPFRPF